VSTIARANKISVSYLHRVFRSSGTTVRDQLKEFRLQHALDLLRSADHARTSMTEIAFMCGFRSSQDFSRAFRQRYESTPSDIRRDRGQ
jgi:AraC-like DNA-binding protein